MDDEELQRAIALSLASSQPACTEETARDDGCPQSISTSNVGETIAAEGAAETVNFDAEIAAAAGGGAKELERENPDAEIMAQMESIRQEVVDSQPLVGTVEECGVLTVEYAENPLAFASGIADLARRYSGLRRVRGDGNCFYRSFIFRYLETLCSAQHAHLLRSEEPRCPELVRMMQKALDVKSMLTDAGYELGVIEDAWLAFKQCFDDLPGRDTASLCQQFREESGTSPYLVWFMRLLAAGYIRTNVDRFAPYIMDDLGAVDAAAYCHREVEPPGKDAEQVQIIALTEALGVGVRIEYLDGRLDARGACTQLVFPEGSAPEVSLLYRPGHYDILYEHEAAAPL